MIGMPRYAQTRDMLGKHGLAPKKRFGQNFLVNRHTAEAIVRAGGISGEDVVVEVGVGLGALTQPLAEQAARVIGLEIDSGIIRFHEEENDLPANVTLLHLDVLKADFRELCRMCGGPLRIMANLPYSISNPFIFKLIENRDYVHSATIMLQKEVAERLMAQPATKEYGVPSVLLQSCATIRRMLTLKPAEFHPRPKIDSQVIRILFSHAPLLSAAGVPVPFALFQAIVRSTFNHRRKTILNTLGTAPFWPEGLTEKTDRKPLAEEAIARAGLAPTLRPEVLELGDFIRLAEAVEALVRERNPAPGA